MPHCQINKPRLPAAGSAKAEAHFSIWGHTEALCVAALSNLQPSAFSFCSSPNCFAVWTARALAKLKLGRITQYLGNHWRYAVPYLLNNSLRQDAGCDRRIRLFQPKLLRSLGRARTASAKAEAHFSIWGHTEALCGATLVQFTSYACFYRARDRAEILLAKPKDCSDSPVPGKAGDAPKFYTKSTKD
jgi:hypothetical protein